MTSAMIKTTNVAPPQLTELETRMLSNAVRTACFDALACADTTYAAAGVSFVPDGRFTKAKVRDYTVASFVGRFSKGQLLQTIRDNIADSARMVGAEILPALKRDLKLPVDHAIGYDLDADLHQVAKRGSRRLTAYIFRVPGSEAASFYGEICIDLYTCQAHLTLKIGDRWGNGDSVLSEATKTVTATDYAELCLNITSAYNGAVAAIESVLL